MHSYSQPSPLWPGFLSSSKIQMEMTSLARVDQTLRSAHICLKRGAFIAISFLSTLALAVKVP
jgi:hypothetical protein